MKNYAAILLVLLFPFALASCGGSSDGEEAGTEQKETPPSSTPEAKPQIYTFSDDSSLTPNVAFATDEEMVIVLGSDLDGKEMPFKSVFLQRDGIGSMLVEISANGLPSAIIAGDAIFKINKYSYAEGKWFMHFSADQNGTISDLTVELPQSFGAHISNLDSWMRNRINTAYQASALQNQSQSNARNIKTEEFLEFVAVTVELGACGISAATANPLIIFWACQSAVRSTIDFLDDAPLVSPTNLDTQKCFFGIGEGGISFMAPACLVATGLRIAADRVRDGDSDISEMEELADKSMDENRFIGEDPVIEDFPTPLLTAPQLAIISPQWQETFSSEQLIPIAIAASDSVNKVSYEVRSIETGAVVVFGDTERTPSGNFESTIQNGILKDGRYVLIVSTADDRPETTNSVSFMISGSTSKVIELYAISTTTPIYQGINLVITGSYNEVYYDQDGNRQNRPGYYEFQTPSNFRINADSYRDPGQQGNLSVNAPSFPKELTICREKDTGAWIAKSVNRSGQILGFGGNSGSGSVSGSFSIDASGAITITTDMSGSFEGYANVLSSTQTITMHFNASFDGRHVAYHRDSVYTANVTYGRTYDRIVETFNDQFEDSQSYPRSFLEERRVTSDIIPSICTQDN